MTRAVSAAAKATLLAWLGCACIVGGGRPYPLYPDPDRTRPLVEIARLSGPIGSIDGQDVSRLGKSFALLPGCHIVGLVEKTGAVTSDNLGYIAHLPGDVFWAFQMQPMHAYEIEFEIKIESLAGQIGKATIHAWDREVNGAAKEVAPARDKTEIDACRKWTPSTTRG